MLIENIDYSSDGGNSTYYQERVLFSLTTMPDYTDYAGFYTVITGIPQWLHMTDLDMDETPMQQLYIRLKDSENYALVDKISNAFAETFGTSTDIKIEKSYEDKQKTDQVLNILNSIFAIAIGIMMFLCFFSLTASMSANLYDQSKEVGILRAMGVTKNRIRLLYFYEALILVFASCMLGVFVGVSIGFTMILQQNLFL